MGAHNTSTIMTESVNYELCVEILVIGKVLYELKILDKDDIQPSPEKLQAKSTILLEVIVVLMN